jgi:hypothetical protein
VQYARSLRASSILICQERQNLFNEISKLRLDLQLSFYPQGFIDSVINSKDSSYLNVEEKPLGSVYITYVKAVSAASVV